MECSASKGNISMDVTEKTVKEMELAVEKSISNHSLAINENSVAPVIIEELDESAISSMDMDINEFIEARALQIKEVVDVIPNYSTFSLLCNSNKDVIDLEDQDTALTADEEDQLTKQFLNGELTFSEYSSRMDQDIDQETIENDTFRYGERYLYVILIVTQRKIILDPLIFLEGRSDSIVLPYKRLWNKSRTKQIMYVRRRKSAFYHRFCKDLWERQI